MGGGPLHDDRKRESDWCSDIECQTAHCRFEQEALLGQESFQERMVKIIAFAVAAIQSSRRIHAPTT